MHEALLFFSTHVCHSMFYDGMRSLIIKMFANSKSVFIMVNFNIEKAFWSDMSNYAGYREFTMDEFLDALEIISFNTYIQFNGNVFKQILGIPMGGIQSPFIADLYLSWREYCYMTKVVKPDYALTILLAWNCWYFVDICTVNMKSFGDIAKDLHDSKSNVTGR